VVKKKIFMNRKKKKLFSLHMTINTTTTTTNTRRPPPTLEQRVRVLEACYRTLSCAFDGLTLHWEDFKKQIEDDITFLEEDKIDPLIRQLHNE